MPGSHFDRSPSRRNLLKAASALPLFSLGMRAASAAEFNYKLATGQSLTQPINARLEQATKRILEASSGRLDIRFFPAGQLGSDTDLLSQVRSGGVDFLNIAGSVLSTVVPLAAITNVGFAFSDYPKVWAAVDGDVGKLVRGAIERSGFVSPAKAGDNGFRQISSSSQPIKSAGDLKGYKIRVPVSPIFTSLFKSLGASPTSINFNELYTSLQTRLVDGQENGLITIESGKLYEVQKFISMTNHIWDPFWMVGNRRAFANLPDNLKDIVRREFDRAYQEERDDIARLETSTRDQLAGRGITFSNADQASFRNALVESGFYREWRDKFGADNWKVLEGAVGKLA